ncbi:UvrD-helicase domain-containing protein [Shewanella intestini]|uniref:DNA 3'-5' helicase n=1 Tax=Shewanella intestini TaxID=2017544 RepID=A0ABS5I0F1_9GAMM|nr:MULTISPECIES: UvrD-helicase domain-containing protein [Shewanella]MBR9727502.1 UvrD-helicase domain-containing protein [Shewanella intestini]MRG35348.1 AAA family ATPase [Shewanella sp. XMDDZSB0408]
MTQPSSYHIGHSWFGYFYLTGQYALTLTTSGIEFHRQQGRFLARCRRPQLAPESLVFSWPQLISPPKFVASFLGYHLQFQADGKPYQIHFLSYFSQRKFNRLVHRLWANANEQKLCDLINRVETTIQSRYLRQSMLDKIRPRMMREQRRWFPWCQDVELSPNLQIALKKLTQYCHWNTRDIDQIRESYIQSQLRRFSDFFEQVESNPLTEKQRRACVIDEDNNLLLAGAGTGKTSVMVGRAGYLVKSGQAQAEDILLLAYGRKAANEMDVRIKQKLATDAIKTSTFHSLGLKIIAEVEGKKPSLSPWVDDEKTKNKWVQNTLDALLEDGSYRKQLFEYVSQYYYVEKSPFEFEYEGEYFQYLNDNDIRSLKGERVKSFGELYIANWFFCHGIEYQYEAKYQHEVNSVEFRQYQPDFYLPEYDIYIEYYGTDDDNSTAPYIDNQQYLASIEWKRELHKSHQTVCLEFFYHQHKKGQLIDKLAQAMSLQHIEPKPLPDEAILATLNELGRVTELAKLFSQLIGLYKSACLDNAGLENIFVNAPESKQTRKAFELLEPILQRYQQQLVAAGDIDFEDMISKAIAYVQQGQFISPWRYIMVDEFQDISEPRARLVKALTDTATSVVGARTSRSNASLFCVGDDWQAIYRFSGADVRLTTQFTHYFGPTATTSLDQTFRFNSSIGDVATQFVTKNPVQLKKDIRSVSQVAYPAVSLIRRGNHQQATDAAPSANALEQALAAISQRVSDNIDKLKTKPTVYLLGRFWFQLPDKNGLYQLNKQFQNLHIECQSFHASKGKEADYVVIMGMKTGAHGFPSQKITPPILDAFLPQVEAFEFAEERRLFYVALTRAKHRVYIVADMTDASPFVIELIKENYAIEQHEFSTSLIQKIFADIHCQRCKTGTLRPRTGKVKTFYSCSHFPLCDHKEQGCSECGSPMTRNRFNGFNVCLNDACGHTAPLCRICGGDMVLRKSARGEFWGCQNYRGNTASSCKHAIDKSTVVMPS